MQELQEELQARQSDVEKSVLGVHSTEEALSATNAQLEVERAAMIQFHSELQEHRETMKARHSLMEDVQAEIASVSKGQGSIF